MKKRISLKKFNKKGDYLLIIAVVILAVVGTVFIYSASNYSANKTYGDGFYFVKKQALGIAIALVLHNRYDNLRVADIHLATIGLDI